jgi:hypothetical protein
MIYSTRSELSAESDPRPRSPVRSVAVGNACGRAVYGDSASEAKLGRSHVDGVYAVASQLVSLGFGRTSRIHGSAASGSASYVESEFGLLNMSDIDVFAYDSSPSEVRILERELTHTYDQAIDVRQTQNAKVSVRATSQAIVLHPEMRSLRWSAVVAGQSAAEYCHHPRRLVTHCDVTVAFPFALQFGLARWIEFAVAPGPTQLTALYELTKALQRASIAYGFAHKTSSISRCTDRQLRIFATKLLPILRGIMSVRETGVVGRWLANYPDSSTLVLMADRGAVEGAIRRFIARTMPRSALLTRMDHLVRH